MKKLNPIQLIRYRKTLSALLPKPKVWLFKFSKEEVRTLAEQIEVDEPDELARAADDVIQDIMDQFHTDDLELPADIHSLLEDLGHDLEP